eukprot:5479880-Ditylum_brightwellii.AAC.1
MLERRWDLSINPPPEMTPDDWGPYKEYEDEDEKARSLSEKEETVDTNSRLIDQQPSYDRITNVEVQLHHQEYLITGKVKRRVLRPNGRTA